MKKVWNWIMDLLFYPAEEVVVEEEYDHGPNDLEIPEFGKGKYSYQIVDFTVDGKDYYVALKPFK